MLQNIYSKFTKEENRLRLHIMNAIVDQKRSFNMDGDREAAIEALGISEEEYSTMLQTLLQGDGAVADEEGNIHFVYPVSAFETVHRVELEDGRSFCAMCAIDAIGAAFTFGQNTKVDSVCAHCGAKVDLEVKDKKIIRHTPQNLHALTFALAEISNWAGSC